MKLFQKLFVLVVLSLFSILLKAQDTTTVEPVTTVSNHSISIDVLSLTYNYEHSLGKSFTVVGRAGFQSAYGYSSQFGARYFVSPAISIEPRYYYNLNRRADKGKRTYNNSANYLAITSWYLFNPIIAHNTTGSSFALVAPNWGIRRVYGKSFLFEFNMGVSYSMGKYVDKHWAPFLNLRLGYAF